MSSAQDTVRSSASKPKFEPGTSQGTSQAVRENYEALREDVAELARSVKSLAGEQLGDTAVAVQEAAEQKMGEMERSIRKNPTQAALIAAGLGFAVGLLLAR